MSVLVLMLEALIRFFEAMSRITHFVEFHLHIDRIELNVYLGQRKTEPKHWSHLWGLVLVHRIYKQVLDRKADHGGLDLYSGYLRRGEKSIRDIVKEIGCSGEFIRFLNSKPLDEAIEICYWRFLGRKSDPGGKNHYLHELSRSEHPDFGPFVESIIDSGEYRGRFGENRIPYKYGKMIS